MGHLEKRIIIGALGLVAVLLTVVIFKGLTPSEQEVLYIPLEEETAEQTWPTKTTQQDDAKTPPVETQDFVVSPKSEEALYVSELMAEEVVAPVVLLTKTFYTIKADDVLGSIAQKELGSVRHVEKIKELNPSIIALKLVIGDVLVLPAKHTLVEKVEAKEELAASSEKTHVVVAGDSLTEISEKYYPGKYEYIEKIVSANPKLLVNGNNTVLHIGDKLNLPE